VTSWAIVEAPSSLGLRAQGVRKLPAALLEAGLAAGIGARRAARVEPPPAGGAVDPATGVLNGAELAAYAPRLASAITDVLETGEAPLVLGGDCSVLLGALLALRGRGRHGLLFADGHADFYDTESEPEGEAASMELALATGRGPPALADLGGAGPLVKDEDVVAIGVRDEEEQRRHGSPPLPPDLLALDLRAVRAQGIEAVTKEALDRLNRPGLAGFWVHVDADVLDDEIMPAVDYRLPGGLRWQELGLLLRSVVGTGRVTGLDVTILNPDLDPDGKAARGLVRCLVAALRC
jgi:arginase